MSLNSKDLPEENKIYMWFSRYTPLTNPMWLFRTPVMIKYWNWCEQYCTGKFDCTLPDQDKKIAWLFEHASDATMFRLKWQP